MLQAGSQQGFCTWSANFKALDEMLRMVCLVSCWLFAVNVRGEAFTFSMFDTSAMTATI